MEKKEWHVILKGMWIGGTMTVPGVSGGSMAMIMGIYDRLISSVSLFWKQPAKSFGFLLRFLVGAALGMILFSRCITWLLATRADNLVRFFFLGAVAGGVPMIYKKAGIKGLEFKAVAYPAIGILAVVILSLLPAGLFRPGAQMGIWELLMQLLGGFIIAVGLVLPGISVSQMLYMLGIYESIMASMGSLQILPLIPLGIGVLGGTFLTANILEKLMARYPQPTYLIILGFMFASLPELIPGFPKGPELAFSMFAAFAGFLCLYVMSLRD